VFELLKRGPFGKVVINVTRRATQQSYSGSIYEVGGRFQSFRINDLELVDQTGIEPVTS
jgi:hypothetical protein